MHGVAQLSYHTALLRSVLCCTMTVPQSCVPPCLPQVVLVSATLPAEVLEMTHKFMTDPIRVLVKRDELTLEVSAQSRVGGAGRMYPGAP